jgi:hypothetical protein
VSAKKAVKASKSAPRRATAKSGSKPMAAAPAGGGPADKKRGEKNPIVQLARRNYIQTLRGEGVPKEQIKERLHKFTKEVLHPAMEEARTIARARDLKSPERRRFIQEAVGTKLGLRT